MKLKTQNKLKIIFKIKKKLRLNTTMNQIQYLKLKNNNIRSKLRIQIKIINKELIIKKSIKPKSTPKTTSIKRKEKYKSNNFMIYLNQIKEKLNHNSNNSFGKLLKHQKNCFVFQ